MKPLLRSRDDADDVGRQPEAETTGVARAGNAANEILNHSRQWPLGGLK